MLLTAENGLELEILKLDTAGNLLWKFTHRHFKTLNRSIRFCTFTDNYEYNYITVDANNNIYACYATDDSVRVNTRWCIMKISPSGTLIWDKMYEGTYGEAAYPIALKVDANANVYATGLGSNSSADDNAMITTKLNSAGVLQWEKLIDGNAPDNGNTTSIGTDLVLDNNANGYLTGHLANNDSSHHFDLVLAKYSSAGALLWSRVINFGNAFARDQMGRKVFLNSNNEIIVCGSGDDTTSMKSSVLLMKFDAAGNEIWRKVFVKDLNGFVYGASLGDVLLDNAGNIVAAIRTGNFGSVGLIAKFSGATGDSLWTYRKDEYSDWYPSSLNVGSNNAVYTWRLESYFYQQLPYKRAWLEVLNPSGGLVTNIVDTTITYAFNDLNTRSIVRVNNSIYCFAHFNDDTPPLMNGLVVKFSAPSGTTNLEDFSAMGAMVFPNPFNSNLMIDCSDLASKEIVITDISGEKVFKTNFQENHHRLNTFDWKTGLYFLEIKTQTQSFTFKLVKF